MKEFGFELRVCSWVERYWQPTGKSDTIVVGRQLGTKYRRWDTIIIETTDAQLTARAPFGTERLDSDLLHVAQHAPSSWSYYRDALPDPGYPWRYVRDAVHKAADRGFIESRRAGNRIEIRRRYRYPDWIDRIIAIENKPDLDAAAARVLTEQLEHDVALGLADEIWVATTTTDEAIEPVLFETMPVEVGVLSVSNTDDGLVAEPIWRPRTLDSTATGTRILDRPAGDSADRSAVRFEYADPAWKQRKRTEIAERTYERGWRSYIETMRSDCRGFELRDPVGPFPWCSLKSREQTASECSARCAAFEPEPPGWRSQGWPIDGGPGKAATRLMERKRARRR